MNRPPAARGAHSAGAGAPLDAGAATTVLGRLNLPTKTRLVSLGSGTFNLVNTDADDLEYLQQYRLL